MPPRTSREPATYDTPCPKCHSTNYPRVTYVWRVQDERGPHLECTCCSHMWREVAR